MPSKSDVAIIRELAARVAEIAALPIQEKKRALWRKLNARRPELILKDLSTVRHEPERLFRWAGVAMEVVGAAT